MHARRLPPYFRRSSPCVREARVGRRRAAQRRLHSPEGPPSAAVALLTGSLRIGATRRAREPIPVTLLPESRAVLDQDAPECIAIVIR